VSSLPPSSEDGNRSSFRNVVFSRIPDDGEVQKLSDSMYITVVWQRLGKHIPAEANARDNRTSIARQRTSKHASFTTKAVFSVWSVPSNGRPSVVRVRFAGMCSPSRCLAIGIHVTIWRQHVLSKRRRYCHIQTVYRTEATSTMKRR
jgi:hypothetical protein